MTQDGPVSTASPDYALLDVGDARRLERFGAIVLDRPAPGADGHVPQDPAAWAGPTHASIGRTGAPSRTRAGRPAMGSHWSPWQVEDGELRFELRLAPSGQVGLFPEQHAARAWIGRQADRIAGPEVGRAGAFSGPTAVLNLFAYTGAATISAARPGVAVTHVDSSRPAVAWARHNAALNDLPAHRSAGSATTPPRSPNASCAAGGAMPGSSSIRRPTATARPVGRGAWPMTCRPCWQAAPSCSTMARRSSCSAPTLPASGPIASVRPCSRRSSRWSGRGAGASIEVADQSLLSEGGTRLHLGSMARWAR